jgi:hypothetical protein
MRVCPVLAERDDELLDAAATLRQTHLACLPAVVARPRIPGNDHSIPFLHTEYFDLVVRRPVVVCGIDRVTANEGTT